MKDKYFIISITKQLLITDKTSETNCQSILLGLIIPVRAQIDFRTDISKNTSNAILGWLP